MSAPEYLVDSCVVLDVVALITHHKRDPGNLVVKPNDAVAGCALEVIPRSIEYVERLLKTLVGRKMPDLKSQDLIYFCIARDRDLTLITEDRKLRNMSRLGGVEAFEVEEMLANLRQGARAS